MNNILLGLIVFVGLSACALPEQHKITFLLGNTNPYSESVDIKIKIDTTTVINDTVESSKVSDSFKRIDVMVTDGVHTLVTEIGMYGIVDERKVQINSDTTIIVEYVHGYEVVKLDHARDTMVEGKRNVKVIVGPALGPKK